MEARIAQILSTETTKTKKIQQLLLLGLTRREVADLVTNGNYGFVYNVHKKMVQTAAFTELTNSLSQVFNRRFGVEIEAYGVNQTYLLDTLRRSGIECYHEGYNHITRPHWKVVSDSSLLGANSFELVSPILSGEAGLKEVKKVCKALQKVKAKVNRSCGLHVHIDAQEFTLQTWKNILVNYSRLEGIIDDFMPKSRRDNRFCKGFREIENFEKRIKRATSVEDIQAVLGTRYRKINAEAYLRHGSVEFRQHGGTTEFEKIQYWVRFLGSLITYSETMVFSGNSIDDLASCLEDDTFTYLKYRTLKFKNEQNEND